MTKKQLEAKLAELSAASPAAATTEPTKAKSTVKIPAWMGTSKSEVIGLDATAGKKFYVTVARRDGESEAPVHSAKANGGKGGPAKARRFDPATLAFILDNEKQMRGLIAAADKLNA